MRLIAVAGSGSGCGKTTLVCRLLAALPGFAAVKISPREGEPRVEWGAGAPGKDTARYAAAGAAKVARVVSPRDRVREAWEGIRGAFAACAGVVVEGAGSSSLGDPALSIVVCAVEDVGLRPDRLATLASSADAIVVVTGAERRDGRHGEPLPSHLTSGRTVFEVSLLPLDAGSRGWEQIIEFVVRRVGMEATE